jgi:hypothetical protein
MAGVFGVGPMPYERTARGPSRDYDSLPHLSEMAAKARMDNTDLFGLMTGQAKPAAAPGVAEAAVSGAR